MYIFIFGEEEIRLSSKEIVIWKLRLSYKIGVTVFESVTKEILKTKGVKKGTLKTRVYWILKALRENDYRISSDEIVKYSIEKEIEEETEKEILEIIKHRKTKEAIKEIINIVLGTTEKLITEITPEKEIEIIEKLMKQELIPKMEGKAMIERIKKELGEIEPTKEEEKEVRTLITVDIHWVSHVRYCPSSKGREAGHDIDIEIEACFDIVVDKENWVLCSGGILDMLASILIEYIRDFLTYHYVLLEDSKESEHGFSRVEIVDEADYIIPDEYELYKKEHGDYNLYYAKISRANVCYGEQYQINYLKSTLEDYIYDALKEFSNRYLKEDYDCYKNTSYML